MPDPVQKSDPVQKMVTRERILLTGGTGRLGTELRALLPNAYAPPRSVCDVTDEKSLERVFTAYAPTLVVHAAAYTDVSAAERDREECWRVNVLGTRRVVEACRRHEAALVHVSTDYVFWGASGGYAEHDPPGPVRNYYALTKLVAEESVRTTHDHLVIRTSFRAREWPYPKAFEDLYTSQDYVDVIAPEVALAIAGYRAVSYDTLHIGTERKSAYDLAKRRRPDVEPASRSSVQVELPADISLDTSRWEDAKPALRAYVRKASDSRSESPKGEPS